MIVIKIKTENAAFHDDGNRADNKEYSVKAWEVARIL